MKLTDEQPTDEIIEADLSTVLSRQWQVSQQVISIAEQLYTARTLWLGSGALPWAHLTAGQKAGYRREIEILVKGDADDIRQRNEWADAHERRNGVKG